MLLTVRLAEAGLLDVNATLLVELIAFIVMIVILGRVAYPRVIAAAEERQRATTEQLQAAERERQEAEQKLREADEKLREAQRQAQETVAAAERAGEQVRQEIRQKADEEGQRMIERARRDIEGERNQALQSLREQVADLVVGATQKVIGASLDDSSHRELIDQAIQQVAVESNGQQPSH